MARSKNCQECTTRRLREAGNDFVVAITNACWRDSDGHPNLHSPTLRMQAAVSNWEALIEEIINEKA